MKDRNKIYLKKQRPISLKNEQRHSGIKRTRHWINKIKRTARIYTMGFRKWRDKIMKLKLEKSIFFVYSSLEAIVHSIQKELLTCKIEQKIKPVALKNFVATC